MAVAQVTSNDSEICLIAFANNGTTNPDAFVAINVSDERQHLDLEVLGSASTTFAAYRTSPEERYVSLGEMGLSDGAIGYDAPAGSVTTFFER
jgi:hypothetical protein